MSIECNEEQTKCIQECIRKEIQEQILPLKQKIEELCRREEKEDITARNLQKLLK